MRSKAIIALLCIVAYGHASAPFVQDIGGSLAFQGQDIIGGAAVIFKPPKRVKDLIGNAAVMMPTRRPARSSGPTEVARNNGRPQPPTTTDTSTAAERAGRFVAIGDTNITLG